MTGESLALSLTFMIESFAFPDRFLGRVLSFNNFEHFLGSINLVALQTLLVISTCIMLCIVLLVVQLCGFHIVLLWKGITTYDFIVNEQKRQRERENARAQKKLEMQNKKSTKTGSDKPPLQSTSSKGDDANDNNDGLIDESELANTSAGRDLVEANHTENV
jgi:hypothetical protein